MGLEHLHGSGGDTPALPELSASNATSNNASLVCGRLQNYRADCSVRLKKLCADELAELAFRGLHEPVNYAPVEDDGAARAACEIVAVMENRVWATG
ncbi:MAG: hypothetical protein ABIX12_14480 [Rubrivivax sp.]